VEVFVGAESETTRILQARSEGRCGCRLRGSVGRSGGDVGRGQGQPERGGQGPWCEPAEVLHVHDYPSSTTGFGSCADNRGRVILLTSGPDSSQNRSRREEGPEWSIGFSGRSRSGATAGRSRSAAVIGGTCWRCCSCTPARLSRVGG